MSFEKVSNNSQIQHDESPIIAFKDKGHKKSTSVEKNLNELKQDKLADPDELSEEDKNLRKSSSQIMKVKPLHNKQNTHDFDIFVKQHDFTGKDRETRVLKNDMSEKQLSGKKAQQKKKMIKMESTKLIGPGQISKNNSKSKNKITKPPEVKEMREVKEVKLGLKFKPPLNMVKQQPVLNKSGYLNKFKPLTAVNKKKI